MTDKPNISDAADGWIELAERCEGGEASRELDGAIRKLTNGDFGFCGDEGWACSACCQPAHELTQEPGCGAPLGLADERTSMPSDWRDDERLPAYTASLDAAMTLVSDEIITINFTFGKGVWSCGMFDAHGIGQSGKGATKILAALSAALKLCARAVKP